MLMIVRFEFAVIVLVFVRAMLAAMLVVVDGGITGVPVLVGMRMRVLVGVLMRVFVRVGDITMGVLMGMRMPVRMVVVMCMLVLAFHGSPRGDDISLMTR